MGSVFSRTHFIRRIIKTMIQSFDKVLGVLYKRVSSQNVIEQKICFDHFSKEEFIKVFEAYINYRSQNEISNLYDYLVSICEEDAIREGRKIRFKSLNVFELLLYVSDRFIDITNNEIRCRYHYLPAWRRMTVELSEDIFVTAFLARRLTRASVLKRGFTWDRIIGHDNEYLHAIMKRGISENHSHLMGAAPIFEISWLSLMNHILDPSFTYAFQAYDSYRRNTNMKYSGEYEEKSFYHRYLQAAVIRLVLFSRLTRRRIHLGNYEIQIKEILGSLCIPSLEDDFGQAILTSIEIEKIKEKIRTCYSIDMFEFGNIIISIFNGYRIKNKILFTFLNNSRLSAYSLQITQIYSVLESSEGKNVSYMIKRLLGEIKIISLECVEELFDDKNNFEVLWWEITLRNAYEMLRNPYLIEMNRNDIQNLIDVLQYEAKNVNEEIGNIDYALWPMRSSFIQKEINNEIYVGERCLMYQMFEEIHLHNIGMNKLYLNLFYAYLLIKENIRSEMVQSNLKVGFANFQHYERRKTDFLVNDSYNNAFIKGAVEGNLFSGNVRHMELRFRPLESAEENLNIIRQMDLKIGYSEEAIIKERFFYTLHFIKEIEEITSPMDYFYCRHFTHRKQVMKLASAIAEVREKYPYKGSRIYGIDAASSEIGCRPEVFAIAFRYLKEHRCMYKTSDGMKKLPQLHATYHVGEDFLDVADGLRAIDEALNFLQLGYGDRLGHALALGIDVEKWYKNKDYKIVLSQQDYIDNLVWIYHKLSEYGISEFENLQNWILREFTVLYEAIYYQDEKGVKADINDYYNAWKLRGDDPSLYENGIFDKRYMEYHREPYLLNEKFPEQYSLRNINEISRIYFEYHFNPRVRRRGSITVQCTVTKNYAKAVKSIQKAMQFEIAARGIAIETNPSSNYHIGTFRSYEDHPIVHFFNKGLVHDEEKLKECAQIPVSINTDDQGIFNTSLENEYALMAAALESVTDENDRKVYHPADIYEWLDNIRIMGNDHSFAEIQKGSYLEGMIPNNNNSIT